MMNKTGEKTTCAQCGAEFECGLAGPQATDKPCWCTELPNVMPVDGESCWCRKCLAEKISIGKSKTN